MCFLVAAMRRDIKGRSATPLALLVDLSAAFDTIARGVRLECLLDVGVFSLGVM